MLNADSHAIFIEEQLESVKDDIESNMESMGYYLNRLGTLVQKGHNALENEQVPQMGQFNSTIDALHDAEKHLHSSSEKLSLLTALLTELKDDN